MNIERKARPYSSFSETKNEIPITRELPYWDFMDDLAVLGDGSLTVGFRLRGLSIETWDVDRINRTAAGLRAMLNSLSDGCEVSFVCETNADFDSMINAHEQLRSP